MVAKRHAHGTVRRDQKGTVGGLIRSSHASETCTSNGQQSKEMAIRHLKGAIVRKAGRNASFRMPIFLLQEAHRSHSQAVLGKGLLTVPEGHILDFDFSGTIIEIASDVDASSRYVGGRVAGTVHGGTEHNEALADWAGQIVIQLAKLTNNTFYSDSFTETVEIHYISRRRALGLSRLLPEETYSMKPEA
ncbi:hypothetical protein WG66_014673, partial [Moniliophthora roreri]